MDQNQRDAKNFLFKCIFKLNENAYANKKYGDLRKL